MRLSITNGRRSLRAFAERMLERLALREDAPGQDLSADLVAVGGVRDELATRPLGIEVLLTQYDRRKYPGALERLIALLDGMRGVEYTVRVVDNGRPGEWSHAISQHLEHVGGDNSAWEFSAFDRGLRHIEREGSNGISSDRKLYLFVTDAYTAYGSEFLGLIHRGVFERALAARACFGWVDAWPDEIEVMGRRVREWLRTSFLIVPAPVLPVVQPFAHAIDRRALFGTGPRQPFAARAPISDNLKGYLTEWLIEGKEAPPGQPGISEGWHSQFVLDEKSFPFFQDKVCAILREFMVSARLFDAGIACYDFRLLAKLDEFGLDLHALDPATKTQLEWGGWRRAPTLLTKRGARAHVEHVELPQAIEHGQAFRAHVEGWLLAPEQPAYVQLRAPTGQVVYGSCSRERQDVEQAFPRYEGVARGFTIDGVLRGLPPGEHELELHFGKAPPTLALAKVQVIAATSFRVRRLHLAETWAAGKRMTVSIEGELRSSVRGVGVTMLLDEASIDASIYLGPPEPDESGLWLHALAVNCQITAPEPSPDHALEVRFSMADGSVHHWRHKFGVYPQCDIAHTLRVLEIGPFRSDAGLTTLKLEAEILDAEPGDRLLLSRNGSELFDLALAVSPRAGPTPAQSAVISVTRDFEGIPPGVAEFTLAIRRQKRSFTLFRGERHVPFERPEITLELLENSFVPGAGRNMHRLALRGWVRNHFFVDCLIIEIDSSRASVLGIDALRPDVAEAHRESLVARQGFDAVVEVHDIQPGEHVVHLIACQRGGEAARVSRRVVFVDAPSGYVSIVSDDLEDLLHGRRAHFYGSIALQGMIETRMDDLVATLILDGRRADEQRFEQSGRHALSLHAAPERSGEHAVRLLVSQNGRAAYETPTRQVHFQRLELPEAPVRALAQFLTHFDLRDKFVGLRSERDLLARLVERQPERIAEFFALLAAAADRLGSSALRSKTERQRAPSCDRPLRVLVVSWEAPHRFHGGGVYLTNLIQRLGRRHEITLVHGHGIDEVGMADALKGSVRKLIGVPRQHRGALYRGDARLPPHFYDVYTPELRKTIELEVQTGAYDLVDYEYTALGPYMVAGMPSVLTVYELGYAALINTEFSEARPVDALVPALERLLRTFHYNVVDLPRLSPTLITLTEEDAAGISTYSDEARVFVNSPGVDAQGFKAPPTVTAADPPTIVYIGNYHHPPNVIAARFFAEEVMPILLARHPNATFQLIGSNVLPEVRALDGHNNVVVLGQLDDFKPELWRASAFVAPLFTGVGMRLKVMEALASGTPLVATALAVRGLEVIDGKHYLEATTAQDFAAAISRLLSDPAKARAIGREGQDLVERDHDWEQAARVRESVWQLAVGEHNSSSS